MASAATRPSRSAATRAASTRSSGRCNSCRSSPAGRNSWRAAKKAKLAALPAIGRMRRGDERNDLMLGSVGANGVGSAYRFENSRDDRVSTAELGVRTAFATGTVNRPND